MKLSGGLIDDELRMDQLADMDREPVSTETSVELKLREERGADGDRRDLPESPGQVDQPVAYLSSRSTRVTSRRAVDAMIWLWSTSWVSSSKRQAARPRS